LGGSGTFIIIIIIYFTDKFRELVVSMHTHKKTTRKNGIATGGASGANTRLHVQMNSQSMLELRIRWQLRYFGRKVVPKVNNTFSEILFANVETRSRQCGSKFILAAASVITTLGNGARTR
jgi:hypothetical protein